MSVNRVLALCKRYGVKVEHHSEFVPLPRGGPGLRAHDGPNWGGIVYRGDGLARENAVIHYPLRGAVRWSFRGYGLLHELSHVLQAERSGLAPEDHDEVKSSMLAFDWYVGMWLALPGQEEWFGDFAVQSPEDPLIMVDLLDAEIGSHRDELLRASLAVAVEEGLLHPTGEPVFQKGR